MKIKIKTDIWNNLDKVNKIIDRISVFGAIMFTINTLVFWKRWVLFGFNLFFSIILWIIQISYYNYEQEKKKEQKEKDKQNRQIKEAIRKINKEE